MDVWGWSLFAAMALMWARAMVQIAHQYREEIDPLELPDFVEREGEWRGYIALSSRSRSG
jgi:hypothetical protein